MSTASEIYELFYLLALYILPVAYLFIGGGLVWWFSRKKGLSYAFLWALAVVLVPIPVLIIWGLLLVDEHMAQRAATAPNPGTGSNPGTGPQPPASFPQYAGAATDFYPTNPLPPHMPGGLGYVPNSGQPEVSPQAGAHEAGAPQQAGQFQQAGPHLQAGPNNYVPGHPGMMPPGSTAGQAGPTAKAPWVAPAGYSAPAAGMDAGNAGADKNESPQPRG